MKKRRIKVRDGENPNARLYEWLGQNLDNFDVYSVALSQSESGAYYWDIYYWD